MIFVQLIPLVLLAFFCRYEKNIHLLTSLMISLYTLVPLFLYEKFPEYSILIGAYTGNSGLAQIHAYVFLYNATYLFLVLLVPRKLRWKSIDFTSMGLSKLVDLSVVVVLLFLLASFIILENEINYLSVQVAENLSMGAKFFVMSVKLYPMILLAFIVGRAYGHVNISKSIIVLSLCIFVYFCIIMGNRVDIAAFLLGFIYIFSYSKKTIFKLKYIINGIFIGSICLFIFAIIEQARGGSNVSTMTISLERFIFQDYFAPFHVFIAAVNKNYIDPLLVLASNFGNLIPGITLIFDEPKPYITEVVSQFINGHVIVGRTQGFASHIYLEGWVTMGFLGFFYSAFMNFMLVNFVISISQRLPHDLGIILIGLWGMCILPIIRSQSVVALRYLLVYIPFILAIYLLFRRNKLIKK